MAEQTKRDPEDSPIQADRLRKDAANFTDADDEKRIRPTVPHSTDSGGPRASTGHRPPAPSGSIEQHLDMNEEGPLRGDELSFNHGGREPDPADVVDLLNRNFSVDMAEDNREGDDMSGDDHSSGMQGGEPELANQPHIESGVPGYEEVEQDLETDEIERHRAS